MEVLIIFGSINHFWTRRSMFALCTGPHKLGSWSPLQVRVRLNRDEWAKRADTDDLEKAVQTKTGVWHLHKPRWWFVERENQNYWNIVGKEPVCTLCLKLWTKAEQICWAIKVKSKLQEIILMQDDVIRTQIGHKRINEGEVQCLKKDEYIDIIYISSVHFSE